MANIKVAVRVRPISHRELNVTGSEVVVRTDVNAISLTNLKVSSSKAGDSRERTRRYGFNYCFDSSDPGSENFADQARIYETLGQSVLEAVFTGYNSCLVAYGQSASGKTYTMMGTKDDPGLTPRLCEGLFTRIEKEAKLDKNYCVSVSYLEIYNERVRDLLKPSSSATGLRVREHPRLGPYVQGLTHHAVHSLGSLMSYVEEGARARKTASTLQNPSSSRSHALLTIAVTEETPSVGSGAVNGGSSSSVRRNEIAPRGGSKIRLVDLAGSESAATCCGVHRLKEGANINKSLVALGNVISALAERGSTGSGPGRRYIPYRDSSLTWLLKDALGGNATTIMLATISPASGSYNETAHTLRFAQRAQSVVNRPVVNEDPVSRIIRELRAEVARLKLLLLEKNTEPNVKELPCCCHRNRPTDTNATEVARVEEETEVIVDALTIKKYPPVDEEPEVTKVGVDKESRCSLPIRRANSSDSVTTGEIDTLAKRFSSCESLTRVDRFAANYKRARVTELDNEEDEVRDINESVFVDIPTLVAVLIKPDDNPQGTSAQIEEICSDEVAEDSIEFIEAVDDRSTFEESEQREGIDHEEENSSVNWCHASLDNEVEAYPRTQLSGTNAQFKSKQKPKFRKQDSIDALSATVSTNLQTSRRFGSVETIARKKEPILSLVRSHTNLEKRHALAGKRLNNIREIEDREQQQKQQQQQQQSSNKSKWRGSKEQLERKGSNESDKSVKDRAKSHARKPSLESLKRKTSKDSSSSSSKDEQISFSSSSSTRDKLLRRKNSLEQDSASVRSHTPIQRVKRAEIVAAVTERLYSSRKAAEDVPEVRSPPETTIAKSLARMKLQEISRKMLGKRKRVCVDTQTDSLQTVRLKDTATLTETPRIVCKDVAVLTEDHADCEQLIGPRTPVVRVKETSTWTERPKTSMIRCKDVASLANDLEEFEYEIHSPRNDSGILSDDTQNYAESTLSSTEVSDLGQEADRRAMYAESSTNTVVFSPSRSFAVQTLGSERSDQPATESKALACPRQCCASVRSSRNRVTAANAEKNVVSITLPDTLCITIETTNALQSGIAVTENDSSPEKLKSSRTERQTQTDESNEPHDVPSRDSARTSLGQTDGKVFRIENIFQDPNNASSGTEANVVADRTEGTRNSITFRNSLGTSYVFESKEGEQTASTGGDRLQAEGFIRDGLITEAFITKKRGFNFKRAPPSTTIYKDPWTNWSFTAPLADPSSIDGAKELTKMASFWQRRVNENAANTSSLSPLESDSAFSRCQTESRDVEETLQTNLSSNDHDHGFSDDSLDYDLNNAFSGSFDKLKQATDKWESLCPPDVVAHTKKDCSKSTDTDKQLEPVDDFENNHVEFPKTTIVESTDTSRIHDYESLIMGRACYNRKETDQESDASSSRVNTRGRKKVSFSSSSVPENRLDRNESSTQQSSKPTLKSIIKKRKKRNILQVASAVHSSNDETDDSQPEEQTSFILESDWKTDVQSTSSEEVTFREDPEVAGSSRGQQQNRKKVKFCEEELHENTCSESDSYENMDEDEEDVLYQPGTSNILEEYLSEAVTFMRNLNSINEHLTSASMLERNVTRPSHGLDGKRGARRRSHFSGRNRDYQESMGREVSPNESTDGPMANDDIAASTESYERCLKGMQRLEECIRRVDKHNELLREKYGVDSESAGARLSLARPSTDARVTTTSDQFTTPRGTGPRFDQRSGDSRFVETGQQDDLEKRIFDQLMNVANSVRCETSGKLRSAKQSDPRSQSPVTYSKYHEARNRATRESFCGDVSGSFSLEGTTEGDDEQNRTTYEISGNLLVGRTRSTDGIVDDDLDSTTEEDVLPLRRFARPSWPISSTSTHRTIKRDLSPTYNVSMKHQATSGSRIIGNDDSLENNFKHLHVQRLPIDDTRHREYRNEDDHWRRIRSASGSKLCGCSREQSDAECSSNELVYLRDKLKYPGSPRARFLELLRERRRIVEYSGGTTSAS